MNYKIERLKNWKIEKLDLGNVIFQFYNLSIFIIL